MSRRPRQKNDLWKLSRTITESSHNKYYTFFSFLCPLVLCFPLPPFVPTNPSTRQAARRTRRAHAAAENQHQHASERARRPSGERTPARERAARASGRGGRAWRGSGEWTRRASECGSSEQTASSLGGASSEAKAEASSLGAGGGYLQRLRPVAVAAVDL